MKINLHNVKVLITGIQKSGKTTLAKQLTNQFKKPVWILYNLDDLKDMPKHVKIILMKDGTIEELEGVLESLIELARQNKIDSVFIDEFDLFYKKTIDLPRHSNNLIINHRHFGKGISVFAITRRPQDIPTKFVESCEHLFVFAQPNSDNIENKFSSIDRELPELMKHCNVENHKYIHKRLGFAPTLMKAIKYNSGGK